MWPLKAPIDWPGTLRHGLQVVGFCFVVAVLTTVIWPGSSYWVQAGNSLCIGMITWGIIEFGRYLIDERYCELSARGSHGWPTGWRGVTLIGLGIAGGFYLGDPLGQFLFGGREIRDARDARIGLVVTIIAGAAATYYFHLRGRAARLMVEKADAERDASEAQLKLLQSQLEPHMLFNTLANLRALIGIDPGAAQQMVDRLNDYLRSTLTASRVTSHSLQTEFERLQDYLELMTIRMGTRLSFSLELPEELRDHAVPPLLLQPLVENAIKHGLEPKVAGGHVRVSASTDGAQRLLLDVRDSGTGFDPASAPNEKSPRSSAGGFGLAQVRERLATAYGTQGSVLVHSSPGRGTHIHIELPPQGRT